MIIKATHIKTKHDIVNILDSLKVGNQMIDILGLEEGTVEYELACESIQEQLLEIDEALIGKEKYNMDNIVNSDIRMMSYWDYIQEEIDQNELFETIRDCSSKQLIDII